MARRPWIVQACLYLRAMLPPEGAFAASALAALLWMLRAQG